MTSILCRKVLITLKSLVLHVFCFIRNLVQGLVVNVSLLLSKFLFYMIPNLINKFAVKLKTKHGRTKLFALKQRMPFHYFWLVLYNHRFGPLKGHGNGSA